MAEVIADQPIYERRTDEINHIIDLAFRYLQSDFPSGYVHHGLRDAYEFTPAVSTTTLVRDLRFDNEQLRVLDVGTGAGGFISSSSWQPTDVVHGVSAYDYRRENMMIDKSGLGRTSVGTYIVGDSERLDEIPELLPQYNLVVSRWMLKHLVEPLGTLEQMANRVAVGGLLAFDSFNWIGYEMFGRDEPTLEVMLEGLERGGFSTKLEFQTNIGQLVEAMRDLTGIPDMIIRRVSDDAPVRFAVQPLADEKPTDTRFPRSRYIRTASATTS